jgi:phosphohistidine swiveling domain-containing protein
LPFLLSYLETGQLHDEWELLARGVPVWGTVVAARARAIRTPDMVVPPGTVAALHNGEYSLSLFRSAAAILTETGDSETAAQMARSCDTTCVVGLNRIGAVLNDGDRVIVDGKRGLVWRHCAARLGGSVGS